MSVNLESDHIFADASCRILVLSSRISQAQACIYRIQNGGKRQFSPPSAITNDANTLSESPGSSGGFIKVPWTITNKYYSAVVHFAAHRIHGLSPHQVQNIPAVIFVWSQGESYKHHIERIAHDLSGCEPEVSLAIRLAPRTSSRPTSPISDDEEEHDIEIDEFLSSYGFEFIDATEKDTDGERENPRSDVWSSEIPGFERVLDALSTIMWPSMETTSKVDIRLPPSRYRESPLPDWANTSRNNSLSVVEEIIASSSEQMSTRTKAMKREMEELARWLEEDGVLQDDPWKSAASTGRMSMSPSAMESGVKPSGAEAKFGFDDDFTVFLSAPALEPPEISGRSTPDMSTGGLSPTGPHARSLYKTLSSVSNFGGSEDGKDMDDNDIDSDLPSKEEILVTSLQIFGTSKLPLPPAVETRSNTAKASNTLENDSSVISDDGLDAFASENFDAGGDRSYDMEPFDLSKVLGALQKMKAEIANMESEGERRRAAARVALGLVYGLEANTEY
ncbi:hypothetical protein E4T56_gene18522 [Termitomyces sp. T112]|nr:hypothetical protein E4T56_gene18522 [Termitomyces sp. T112]